MKEILLDSNPIQKDLRIRRPNTILSNMSISVGTVLDIYLDTNCNEIILRISKDQPTNSLEPTIIKSREK